ncbi:ChaN family lipoprotein [Vibrio maerlii]|uniref:ChaN family lipoprotein n=1 Tax=Vibrio maerlii TaxID=2231648 RepID=UPI000E3C5680|nr:ChaN family lipoprotein [Vibrio maerlii]
MRTLTLLSLALLSGCSAMSSKHTFESDKQTPISPLQSYYDYSLATPSGNGVDLSQLANKLKDYDVVLVGEWHTHPAVHLFQAQLFQQLATSGEPLALSMEQFSRPEQPIIDQYLAGEVGEQILIKQGKAWPNYESDYRSLVELAKANNSDIIAANAPKDLVRCIGREGIEYLDRVTPEQRQMVASQIDLSDTPYRQKFMASMHHGSPEQTSKQYAAQVTWDETMAESIVEYITEHPTSQVIHVAGKFHTEGGLGTAQSILKRNPQLSIAIVTPVSEFTSEGSDYQLKVLTPPARYVKKENRMQAYHSLSKRNHTLTCEVED